MGVTIKGDDGSLDAKLTESKAECQRLLAKYSEANSRKKEMDKLIVENTRVLQHLHEQNMEREREFEIKKAASDLLNDPKRNMESLQGKNQRFTKQLRHALWGMG